MQAHSDVDSVIELYSFSVENFERFIKDFPNSKYINEARLLLHWKSITCKRNIFEINDFIKENRGFLLIKEAYELLDDLKVEELKSMQASIQRYPPNKLSYLIESNIFQLMNCVNTV